MLLTKTKQRVIIDCGGAHISVGLFSFGEKSRKEGGSARLQLEAYVREDFVCSPAHSTAWSAQVGAALDRAWGRLGLRSARACRLAIPGHLGLTKLVKTPAVPAEAIAEVLRFEAGQAIPFSLDKVSWGGVVLRNDGEEMDLLISAVKLDAVEPLCAAVESVRLSPTHCEPAALALWRALSCEVREPSLWVDVGARSTQVIIGGGASPLYLRTLNFGGNAVTSALAQTLGCDFAEAEAAKRRASQSVEAEALPSESGSLLRDAVQQAANSFVQKLGAELRLTKFAYLRQPGAPSPTRAYLCGGGGALPGLGEEIAEVLSLPVFELPPPAGIEFAASLAERASVAASDLYTLYGLALGAALPDAQQINLLPPTRHAVREVRGRRRWQLAAAALLVLLPFPLLLQQRLAITALRTQVAAVDAAVSPLLRLSSSNAQAQAEVDLLRTRLADLDGLNVRRESWLTFLADLQARLNEVGDVWLERLHYNFPRSNQGREADLLSPAIIELGGWVLDSERTDETLQRLFESLQVSDFVQAVERERYDRSRPGVIHFEAGLVLADETPL